MDLYSRLMGIEEVIEYLNEKTNRNFNQDKTIKFIKEKNIAIVFKYEGWATWEFQHKSGYQSLNIQVNGYFNFRNSSEAVEIFKGLLEEINIGEAIIYQLDSYHIRNNVPDGIAPKEDDEILFKTGGRPPMFSNLNIQNVIKIDNDKVGVLKQDLEEYLNKMQIEHMDNKTKIETLESKIENLETENASLIQQPTTKPINKEVSTRNQDKKLIAIMALLLAQKSNVFQVGNRPNATQISDAIFNLAQQKLQIIDDDMVGLKSNTAKISSAINEYSHIIKNKPKE